MSNKFKSSKPYGESEQSNFRRKQSNPRRKQTDNKKTSEQEVNYRHILMDISAQYFSQLFIEELTNHLSDTGHNLSEIYHILENNNPNKELAHQVYDVIIDNVKQSKQLIIKLTTQGEIPNIPNKEIESFYHIPNNPDDMFMLLKQIDDEFSDTDIPEENLDNVLDFKIQKYGVTIIISNIFHNQLIYFPCCKSKIDNSRVSYACRPTNPVSFSESNDFDTLNTYCPYCGKQLLTVDEYEELTQKMNSNNSSDMSMALKTIMTTSLYNVFLNYLEDGDFDFQPFTFSDIYQAFEEKQFSSELIDVLYNNLKDFHIKAKERINDVCAEILHQQFEFKEIEGLHINFAEFSYETVKNAIQNVIASETYKNEEDDLLSYTPLEGFLVLLYKYANKNK